MFCCYYTHASIECYGMVALTMNSQEKAHATKSKVAVTTILASIWFNPSIYITLASSSAQIISWKSWIMTLGNGDENNTYACILILGLYCWQLTLNNYWYLDHVRTLIVEWSGSYEVTIRLLILWKPGLTSYKMCWWGWCSAPQPTQLVKTH